MKLSLLMLGTAAGAAVDRAVVQQHLAKDAPQQAFLRGLGGALAAAEREGGALAQQAAEAIHTDIEGSSYTRYLLIGGVALLAIVIAVAAIAVVLKRRAARDTSVALHVTFAVPAGKLKDFRSSFVRFYDAICPSVEGMLYYGFTVDEQSSTVVCREAYKDAAGVLKHLEHVDSALKHALTIGRIASLEAVGPAPELEKLQPALGPLGCRFYPLEEGSKLYGASIPGAKTKRGVDTSCLLRRKFQVPSEKIGELVGVFQDSCGSLQPDNEKLLYYSMAVDEAGGMAVISASFEDGDGVAAHVGNVSAALEKASDFARVESVELHGPGVELDKASHCLTPQKCKFFVADVNCKTWIWKGGDVTALVGGQQVGSAVDIFAATAKRMAEQLQSKVEKGSRAYEILEAEAVGFQDKAKVFLINELNTTAQALLKAIDEEEAQMLLEFNRSVEASFPPVSVLLAGILSPAILSMSYVGHIVQLFMLFLPIALGTGWSLYEDWGAHCDIPTMAGWTWFTFIVTSVLVVSHGLLARVINAGQAVLKEKTEEISHRLSSNAADGETSISDMQEIFIGSTVLVQEALLLEDQVKRSIWRILIGPFTVLWMVAVLWNFIIVIGWTFVPGQISFFLEAHDASAGAFCGAWASVFVARLVCLLTPFFFFINVGQVIQWIVVTVISSSTVSSKVLGFAQNFDRMNTGVPITEILIKAFLLRGSHDVFPARMTVALGEALRLSLECEDLEQQLNEVDMKIKMGKEERKALRKAATNAGEDMSQNLQKLQEVGDADTGEWKSKGKELVMKAEQRARQSREVATAELDKISQYLMELAEQIKNSETYKDALKSVSEAQVAAAKAAAEAQEAAAHAASDAQAAATQLAAQAQAGLDRGLAFAQSEEAQAALAQVSAQAQGVAQQAAASASSAAQTGMDQAKKGAQQARKHMGK